MNNKQKAVKALMNVGLDKVLVDEFKESHDKMLINFSGGSKGLITEDIMVKCYELVRKRSKYGIEIVGILFKENLEVTFLFYVDGNPENAWFERNLFFDVEDFDKELDHQLQDFINLVYMYTDMRPVFYKGGIEIIEVIRTR